MINTFFVLNKSNNSPCAFDLRNKLAELVQLPLSISIKAQGFEGIKPNHYANWNGEVDG